MTLNALVNGDKNVALVINAFCAWFMVKFNLYFLNFTLQLIQFGLIANINLMVRFIFSIQHFKFTQYFVLIVKKKSRQLICWRTHHISANDITVKSFPFWMILSNLVNLSKFPWEIPALCGSGRWLEMQWIWDQRSECTVFDFYWIWLLRVHCFILN